MEISIGKVRSWQTFNPDSLSNRMRTRDSTCLNRCRDAATAASYSELAYQRILGKPAAGGP